MVLGNYYDSFRAGQTCWGNCRNGALLYTQRFADTQKQSQNGYRYYSDSDLARLMFVRKARLLGFGLNEITEILQMSEHGHSPCPRVRKILEKRLQDTRKN